MYVCGKLDSLGPWAHGLLLRRTFSISSIGHITKVARHRLVQLLSRHRGKSAVDRIYGI